MRAALAILLVPALAAAAPKFSTTISASSPFADGVVAVRAKLDACWRKDTSVKMNVTVTAGVVKTIELVEVDPKAPLPCVTKALRTIKLDAATNGVFELSLHGTDLVQQLRKLNLNSIGMISGTGPTKGPLHGTGVGTGTGGGGNVQGDFVSRGTISTGSGAGSGAPQDVNVQLGTPDGTAVEIDRIVRSRAGVFRACYQKELARRPKLAGRISIKFSIGTDGTVTKAVVHATSMKDTHVEDCLRNNIMRLRFPAAIGPADLTYPFIFSQG